MTKDQILTTLRSMHRGATVEELNIDLGGGVASHLLELQELGLVATTVHKDSGNVPEVVWWATENLPTVTPAMVANAPEASDASATDAPLTLVAE